MIAISLAAGLATVLCWAGVLWFGFGETGPAWLVPLLAALFVVGGLTCIVCGVLGIAGFGPQLTADWSWE